MAAVNSFSLIPAVNQDCGYMSPPEKVHYCNSGLVAPLRRLCTDAPFETQCSTPNVPIERNHSTGTLPYLYENSLPKAVRQVPWEDALNYVPPTDRPEVERLATWLSRGGAKKVFEVYWPETAKRELVLSIPIPTAASPQCLRSVKQWWYGKCYSYRAAGMREDEALCKDYQSCYVYSVVIPNGSVQGLSIVLSRTCLESARETLMHMAGKCEFCPQCP